MKTVSRRMQAVLALAVAGLVAGASGQAWGAATTGFSQTTAGPFDYNTSTNWVGGNANGLWDSSLTLTANQGVTFAADTVLSGGLTFNYAGAYNESLWGSGANHKITLAGDVIDNTVANQTVYIGNGTTGQNLNVDMGGVACNFTVSAGRGLQFQNVISNGTGLNISGGGTLGLYGANTFTGPVAITGTTVNTGGNVTSGAASALGNSSSAASNITIDGGTLGIGYGNSTDHLFTIGAGGATFTSAASFFTNTGALAYTGTGARTITFGVNSNGGHTGFAPVIGDAAVGQATNLLVSANLRWTLQNTTANTYSGGTTVSNGFLASSSTVQSFGTGSVTVAAGCGLEMNAFANLNTTGGATVLLNGTATNPALLDLEFDASVSQINTILNSSSTNVVLSLMKDGSGSTAQALDLNAIGNGSYYLSGAGQATAGFQQTTTYNATSLGVGAGNTYRLGGGPGNGHTLSFSHDVLANTTNGTQNNLVLAPAGSSSSSTVQFLTSNSTFSGTTAVNSGKLTLAGAAGALLQSDITANASGSGNTATVVFDSSTNGVTGTVRAKSLTLNGASLTVNGNSTANSVDSTTNTLTVGTGAANGAGGGSDIITLNPNSARNAQLSLPSITRNNGAVVLFRGTNLGANTVSSATANTSNISIASAPALVGGGGSAGSHNISIIPWALGGTTTGDAGSTFVTYDAANGIRPLSTTTEYDTTITSGAITTNNVYYNSSTALALTANSTINSLYLNNTGNITGTGITLSVTSGDVFINNQLTISANLAFGSATGYLGQYSAGHFGSTISGNITGTNGIVVYNNGAPSGAGGTLNLSGNNTYTGDTVIVGGLQVGSATAIPNGAGYGNVVDYGFFDLRNVSATINGLSGNGTVINSYGNQTLTIGNNNATSTFNGVLQFSSGNTLNITKIGTGTLTLTSLNSYNGSTTIKGGSIVSNLAVSGTPIGTGSLVMSGGSTLSLAPGKAVAETIAGGSAGTFTFNDISTLSVSNGVTVTIGGNTNTTTANLVRGTASGGPGGILAIVANSGINSLGTASGENVLVAGSAANLPAVTNGVVAPYILGVDSTTGVASLLTYSSAGFGQASYTTHASGTWTLVTNEVSDVTGNSTAPTGAIAGLRVDSGVTLTLAPATTLTVGPGTSGTQAGIVLNAGSIAGGTLNIGAAEAIVYAASGTVGTTSTVASVITGSGTLTKAGAGKLILGGANTYTGTTAIYTGTVQNGVVNALPTTTTLTLIGGTYDLAGYNQTLAGLADGSSTSGTITSSSGPATLTVNNTATITVNSVLNGGLSLAKSGTGSLTINNASYTGGTTVNAGTLTLLANSASTGPVVINGGTFNQNGVLANVASFTINGGTWVQSTAAPINGAIPITVNSGTATLSASNADASATTINGGTLSLAGTSGSLANSALTANLNSTAATVTFDSSTAGVIGAARASSVMLNAANLNVKGNSTANSVDTITNALTANLGTSVVSLTPNSAKNTGLTAASFARTAGSIVLFRGTNLGVNSAASVTANSANITFTSAPTLSGSGVSGTTTIGILAGAYGDTTAAGGGTGSTGGLVTYDSANGVRLLNTSTEYASSITNGQTVLNNIRFTNSGTVGTTTLNSATVINSLSFNSSTAGSGNTISGTGTLKLSSGAIYASQTVPQASMTANDAMKILVPTLDLNGVEGTILCFTTNNTGGTTYSNGLLQISSAITNANGVTFGGGGYMQLTGSAANTYTGTTTVDGTHIQFGKSAGINAIPGNLVINSGEVFDSGNQIPDAATVTINNGGLYYNNSNNSGSASGESYTNLVMTGGFTSPGSGNGNTVNITGTMSLSGGSTGSSQGGKLNVTGLTTLSGGILTVNKANSNANVSDGQTNLNGGLTIVNTSSSAYTPITINAGTASNNNGGKLTLAGDIIFTGNATNTNTATISAAAGTTLGTVALNGTRTFTISKGAAAVDLTIAAPITDNGSTAGGIIKGGLGTMTLTASNTYTGGTIINGGTLAVAADSALGAGTSTVTINGGTLDATTGFSTSRSITLGTGSPTIQVDAGTMTLNSGLSGSGGLTKTGGGILQLTAAGTSHTLQTLGSLTISGGTLDLTNHDLFISGGAGSLRSLAGKITTSGTNPTAHSTTVIALLTGSEYLALGKSSIGLGASPTTVTGGDLVGVLAYAGDANLDGKVGADDYLALDMGYMFHLTGWTHGDFDQDGSVTVADFAAIDNNLLNQSGSVADSEIALHTQWFGAAYTDAFNALNTPAAVPEPASLALLGLGAVALLRRKK